MKKLFTVLTATLLSLVLAFGLTACSPATPPETPPTCQHTYEATEWFDGAHHFASKLVCSGCQDEITRNRLEITNAQELVYLAQDINSGASIGGYTSFFFTEDIDLTGTTWTPINICSEDGYDYVFKSGKTGNATISGLTVSNQENAGLFGLVQSKLTIEGITLDNATISGNNASAFIGTIDCTPTQTLERQNVEFKNLKVSNSTISGTDHAGAAYAYATGYNGGDALNATTISINGFDMNAVTVSTLGYAGALMGAMSDYSGDFVDCVFVIVEGHTFTNVTVTSTQANGAGRVIGIIGYSDAKLGDVAPPTWGVESNFGSATANGESITRCYGRTGWTGGSEGCSFNFEAANTLKYESAVN